MIHETLVYVGTVYRIENQFRKKNGKNSELFS